LGLLPPPFRKPGSQLILSRSLSALLPARSPAFSGWVRYAKRLQCLHAYTLPPYSTAQRRPQPTAGQSHHARRPT
jgi:hypothetical protein